MGDSAFAAAKAFAAHVPFAVKTAFCHATSLSPTASKWDFRTEMTVNFIRHVLQKEMSRPHSISKIQRSTMRASIPPSHPHSWIIAETFPTPEEDDIRQALLDAIRDLKSNEETTFSEPELKPTEGEWTAYTKYKGTVHVADGQRREAAEFGAMMDELGRCPTILYLHGGAHYLMDPASHRTNVSRLTRFAGGRAFSVRYRLSPQNPFPASLLDALLAYLTLLYPPDGSLHTPIPASEIVFAGDSAGGMLVFALTQLLLQLQKASRRITFNGREVEVPLPAGVTGNSPFLDVTSSMPSMEANTMYDYLPPPSVSAEAEYPPCDVWPTDPPRVLFYCNDDAMMHPLVSPLAATNWEGCPPAYVVFGQELLEDENRVFLRRLARQGVKVRFEYFEAMPHCFALALEKHPAARVCFESWGQFVCDVTKITHGHSAREVETEGIFVAAKSLERTPMDASSLSGLSEGEVGQRMLNSQRNKMQRFQKLRFHSRL
ncbi:Alpha/Beta hydrolase protein [Lineolata rhizophorae]|uniref:Alpha/Beta hydrolase protein n=1 Tax=Lineolata rhizophorae TaxID=578093 RepID=A0A6A6NNK4_9PEZI|nr:Alpha/Beta hydrolase protein [Lineolata rhizophorae]